MSSFVSLCFVVCFAVAALGCLAAIGAVETTWALLWLVGRTRGVDPNRFALFVVRTLPLSVPAATVLFGVLPSFVLFEPRQTAETPEWWLIALAVCALFALAFVSLRMGLMFLASWRAERKWLRSATKLDIPAPIPVYALNSPVPLVAVVGLFCSRMFISERVLDAFTPEELQSAIAHEWAHVRSLDNLKQVVLRATRFSSTFAQIDHALCRASEIDADNRAIMDGVSPVDLGSAILKVARMETSSALLPRAAMHLVPQAGTSVLRVRIERLEAAFENGPSQRTSKSIRWLILAGVLATYAVSLSRLLALSHKLTEVLVR